MEVDSIKAFVTLMVVYGLIQLIVDKPYSLGPAEISQTDDHDKLITNKLY